MGSAGSTGDALVDGLVDLGEGLAFNRHLGVEVVGIGEGWCHTRLPANPALDNHLGGVHAIAELAPVELAGALAASTRLRALLERGYVPVVGGLQVRYLAPARGTLDAEAAVDAGVVEPALAAADEGRKPHTPVAVTVRDQHGTVVAEVEVVFVYVPMDPAAAGGADETGQ